MYIVIVHNAIYLLYIVAQLNFDEVLTLNWAACSLLWRNILMTNSYIAILAVFLIHRYFSLSKFCIIATVKA